MFWFLTFFTVYCLLRIIYLFHVFISFFAVIFFMTYFMPYKKVYFYWYDDKLHQWNHVRLLQFMWEMLLGILCQDWSSILPSQVALLGHPVLKFILSLIEWWSYCPLLSVPLSSFLFLTLRFPFDCFLTFFHFYAMCFFTLSDIKFQVGLLCMFLISVTCK